jgi:hypothetical protein
LKPRFFLIVGVLFIFLIAVVAVAASNKPETLNPTPTPTPTSPPTITQTPQPTTVTISINNEIGVKQVTITNINTGTSITKRNADLPFMFKASRGDTIRFNVITEEGYIWNAWMFQSDTFDNHNPLTLKVTSNLAMSPICLEQEAPVE